MKKSFLICFTVFVCIMLAGCSRDRADKLPSVENFAEEFGDDYFEYPSVDKADDYFKQCFEKVEGDWRDNDNGREIGFYIDGDMYMMSGWTNRDRIIAFIEPVRNHENQFRIGLEAGELQEILTCEIVRKNEEIIINETVYVR